MIRDLVAPGILQNVGPWEVLLIFLVVLILFGAKRLPELFRSFGQSIKEFKKATQDIQSEVEAAMNEDVKPSNERRQTKAEPEGRASMEGSTRQSSEAERESSV